MYKAGMDQLLYCSKYDSNRKTNGGILGVIQSASLVVIFHRLNKLRRVRSDEKVRYGEGGFRSSSAGVVQQMVQERRGDRAYHAR